MGISAGAAILGSAAIGGVSSAISSSNAAAAQEQAANEASQTELQMYNTTRGDLLPYNTAGQTGSNALLYGLGLGGSAGSSGMTSGGLISNFNPTQAQLEATPGYSFEMDQGLKSTQSAMAARGLGSSGAAMKGAAGYATGLANNTYNNLYSIYSGQQTNNYNRLMGLSTLGESAAAQTGAYGTQTANSIGGNDIGAGNAAAAGDIGVGNALSGMTGSFGGTYLTNALLQQNGGAGLFGGGGGGYPAETGEGIYQDGLT